METGIYEEIVRPLKKLPAEKVLEANHFIDLLELQNRDQSQGEGGRFSDLWKPPAPDDANLDALIETVGEGYSGTTGKVAHS